MAPTASSYRLSAIAITDPDLITSGFQRRPSCVQSSLSRRGKKTADRNGSWCTTETLRYFSSAHPRPEVVDGSLPPGRERFSSAGRCGLGRGRLERAADIFHAPDRTLSRRGKGWRHIQTAIRI